MKQINQTFFKGLAVLLPIALTLYLTIWAIASTESIFRSGILIFLPEQYYIAGMGFALGLVIIFLTGWLIRLWVIRTLIESFEHLLEKIPLVRTVFSAIKDFFSYFSSSKKSEFQQVVLYRNEALGMDLVGLVTLDETSDIDDAFDEGDRVGVYLPMSYQIGGFMIFAPRESLTPLDMSMEDAMRFIMTAGVSQNQNESDSKRD